MVLRKHIIHSAQNRRSIAAPVTAGGNRWPTDCLGRVDYWHRCWWQMKLSQAFSMLRTTRESSAQQMLAPAGKWCLFAGLKAYSLVGHTHLLRCGHNSLHRTPPIYRREFLQGELHDHPDDDQLYNLSSV